MDDDNDRVLSYLRSPLGRWMSIRLTALQDLDNGVDPSAVIETAMREAVQLALETQ